MPNELDKKRLEFADIIIAEAGMTMAVMPALSR